ncbi:hypothetical protein GCM10007901_34020 [Dyella acidisoli]|uniref:Serine aminopeptidase S33 domain-containing protein n=1 Tax=Dyella acidisoli TaxID=1867834 RepID=A0ABQ5XRS5_9GAMM|nr:hypothetical protein GCM10007901_34020 [Dyella acidisoli]
MKTMPHRLFKALMAGALITASTFTYASNSNACQGPKPGAMAAYQTMAMQANDGVCLQLFSWKATQSPPRGVVVIVHGLRDHSLRYDDFSRELSEHGFAVFAQDLRGHAHSGGRRQRFNSMAQMVSDVDLAVNEAKKEYPGVPAFVYGHSLGGLITTEYALAHANKLDGVILSGAALQRPHSVSGIQVGLARIIASIAPGANVVAVDDSEFSRDKDVMASLADDPLISHQKLPAASAVATINGMADVQKKMGQITMPILVLYGTGDKVNPPEGSQTLYSAVSSRDKALKAYDGAYHDILHDPQRAHVTADVIAWLSKHAPSQQVAAINGTASDATEN